MPKPINFCLHHQGNYCNIHVIPCHEGLFYSSYTVTDSDGYLFSLIPTNNPFTDFTISDRDVALNHPIEWPLVDKVKEAIINHFM
jgi:hypothetical protein